MSGTRTETVELLKVADAFELSSRGLVLAPDLPVPEDGWQTLECQVQVQRPDGSTLDTPARLELAHFQRRDEAALPPARWRVVVTLAALRKHDVPVGSRVRISASVRDALLGTSSR